MRNLLMLLTICGLPFLAGCNQSGSSEAGSTLSNAVFSILEPEPVCCCAAPVNERPEPAPVKETTIPRPSRKSLLPTRQLTAETAEEPQLPRRGSDNPGGLSGRVSTRGPGVMVTEVRTVCLLRHGHSDNSQRVV